MSEFNQEDLDQWIKTMLGQRCSLWQSIHDDEETSAGLIICSPRTSGRMINKTSMGIDIITFFSGVGASILSLFCQYSISLASAQEKLGYDLPFSHGGFFMGFFLEEIA